MPRPMPNTINVAGRTMKARVLRVQKFDELGQPEVLTYLPDDRAAELSKDPKQNHFVIVYGTDEGFGPNPARAEQPEQ
jgi:hypothetical protein